jgi:adenine phosphoribosyltransferase
MLSVLQSLQVAGAVVKDVVAVIQRGDGVKRLAAEGYDVKTIVRVEVDERHVTEVIENNAVIMRSNRSE